MFYIHVIKEFSFLGKIFTSFKKISALIPVKKSLLFYKYGTLYTMHTVTGKSIFISELFLTLFVVSIETVKLDFFNYTRKFVLLCPYSVKEACNVIHSILVQSSAISAARYWDFTFKRYLLYLVNLIIYINLVTLDQTV